MSLSSTMRLGLASVGGAVLKTAAIDAGGLMAHDTKG